MKMNDQVLIGGTVGTISGFMAFDAVDEITKYLSLAIALISFAFTVSALIKRIIERVKKHKKIVQAKIDEAKADGTITADEAIEIGEAISDGVEEVLTVASEGVKEIKHEAEDLGGKKD